MSFTVHHDLEQILAADINAIQDAIVALQTSFDLQGVIVAGDASLLENVQPPGLLIPYDTNIITLSVRVGTAPVGASLIVQFNLDGVSIGTVSVLSSQLSGSTNVDIDALQDQVITFDITQIGSTTPGADIWIRMIGQ